MPEGIEIAIYRQAADQVVGRTITHVDAPDDWFLKGGLEAAELSASLVGRQIEAVRSRGKLMIVDLDDGERLGLRFGMTGRLVVDGQAAINQLEYAPHRDDPSWIRFRMQFDGGGYLAIHDPRRLGAVQLRPDEEALGADMFSIELDQLRHRVLVGEVALKARLLDQKRIAGVGNLIADEVLWRAGIDPARAAKSLDETEQRGLLDELQATVSELMRLGGSHTGRLYTARVRGGCCPDDGTELERRTIGGRTTYSCPQHQV